MRTYTDVIAERMSRPMSPYRTEPGQYTVETRYDGSTTKVAMSAFQFGQHIGSLGGRMAEITENAAGQGVIRMANDTVVIIG